MQLKTLCQPINGICSQCGRSLPVGLRRTCPAWRPFDPIPVDKTRPVGVEKVGRPAGPIPVVREKKKGCCGGEKQASLDDPPALAPSPDEE